MSLQDKYDRFYGRSLEIEHFTDVAGGSWPTDRVRAILHDCAPGETVLDVGCGNGFLLYQLRDRFSHFVGLEYSSVRLAQAALNLSHIDFQGVAGSAEDMKDIESSTADVIVSADVIEHIPDVYRATDEMFRVLKPGGVLVINTPNIAFIKKRLLLLAGRFPSTSQPNEGIGSDILFDGGHLHYFTFRSLSLVLRKAGFKSLRKTGFGRLGALSHWWPEMLSSGVQLVCRKP
jgi:SAM-dependent methyltransferase